MKMIKETNKHDKTSNRLLRKLMRTDASRFNGRKDDKTISLYKIKRDIDEDLAPEILDALEFVANSEKFIG